MITLMPRIVCAVITGVMIQAAHAGEPFLALRKAERIVAAKGEGYFPVMIKLHDGTLIAAIRGGTPHMGIGGRLDIIRSADGGRTWSPPTVAVDSPWDDRNPGFGQMPDGTLVLAYCELHGYRPDGTFDLAASQFLPFLITSGDDGKTWSKKRLCVRPWPGVSPFGKIIVCKDGTALLSLYKTLTGAVGILRSTDNDGAPGAISRSKPKGGAATKPNCSSVPTVVCWPSPEWKGKRSSACG